MQLLHLQSQMRVLMTNRQLKVQHRRLPGTTCHSVPDVGEKVAATKPVATDDVDAVMYCTVRVYHNVFTNG